eukprot:2461100-Rhodomonas_salina.2
MVSCTDFGHVDVMSCIAVGLVDVMARSCRMIMSDLASRVPSSSPAFRYRTPRQGQARFHA